MSSTTTKSPFQDVPELAELFRVKPRTIRDWRRRGKLRAVRVGRSLLFRRDDVERLIKNHVEDGPKETA